MIGQKEEAGGAFKHSPYGKWPPSRPRGHQTTTGARQRNHRSAEEDEEFGFVPRVQKQMVDVSKAQLQEEGTQIGAFSEDGVMAERPAERQEQEQLTSPEPGQGLGQLGRILTTEPRGQQLHQELDGGSKEVTTRQQAERVQETTSQNAIHQEQLAQSMVSQETYHSTSRPEGHQHQEQLGKDQDQFIDQQHDQVDTQQFDERKANQQQTKDLEQQKQVKILIDQGAPNKQLEELRQELKGQLPLLQLLPQLNSSQGYKSSSLARYKYPST